MSKIKIIRADFLHNNNDDEKQTIFFDGPEQVFIEDDELEEYKALLLSQQGYNNEYTIHLMFTEYE